MFAAHDMDKFSEQIIGAGMGWFEGFDRSHGTQPRGAGHVGARAGQSLIAVDPIHDLNDTGRN